MLEIIQNIKLIEIKKFTEAVMYLYNSVYVFKLLQPFEKHFSLEVEEVFEKKGIIVGSAKASPESFP